MTVTSAAPKPLKRGSPTPLVISERGAQSSARIPKYRLHKPSGQALVAIRGQRIYLGKYDSPESKEKYHQLIAEYLPNKEAAQVANPNKSISINELILQYFRFAKNYYIKNGKPTDEVSSITTTTLWGN